MLAVMTIEILLGLLVAVILSLFVLVWHASKPKLAVREDICHSAIQAYMDYFVSESREDNSQALLRVQLLETREVLQARMSEVPSERQSTIGAVLDAIDKEVKQIEGG